MKYAAFEIGNYRAIESIVTIDLSKNTLIPLVGINECGKTTILQAIYCFDYVNDSEYGGKHLKDTKNLYKTSEKSDAKVTAKVELKYNTFSEIYSDFLNEEQPKETEVNQSTSEGNSSVLLGALSAKRRTQLFFLRNCHC